MTDQLNNRMIAADPDTESRRRIVAETDKNFFVEAGAGSGKTTLLVHRMTAMIEQGKEISRICAITFTRAAANEFYDRFRKLLLVRSRPEKEGDVPDRFLPPTTEVSRQRCAAALKDIDLCFMGTIDSFCNRILGEHPTEAGLPSELSLISDEELEDYLRQAYVRISKGEMGEDLKAKAQLLRRLHYRPEDVFAAGAAFLLKHRNVRFQFQKMDERQVQERLEDYRLEVVNAVRALAEHPEKMPEKQTNDSARAWQSLEENQKLLTGRWEYHYNSVLGAVQRLIGLRLACAPEDIGFDRGDLFDDWVRKGKNGDKLLGTEIKKDTELIRKMRDLPYDLALTFLKEALPVLEAGLKESGRLTYFDYLYYLRNMLRKDAAAGGKLASYIANAHSYYLIDEFQDTDPLQAEVFFYLSAREPEEKWSDCIPREGSLFIVGDPKQSIYRFRDADVTSFLRVKSLFDDPSVGEVLNLTRNFRSTKDLREYFNRCFTGLLPEQTEVQSRYEPIPIEEEEQQEGFGGIWRYSSYRGSAAEDHPEESDPRQVGRIIRQMVGSPEYAIWDKDKKEIRPLSYGDFMLITVAKASLAGFSKEFERLGIPCRVEGNVPFAECPALVAVTEVYAALADPTNGIAVYRALKGALVGLSENQIKAYRAGGGRIGIRKAAPATDDQPAPKQALAARTAFDRLRILLQKAEVFSPAALFRGIARTYRVFERTGGKNAEIFWYVEEQLRAREACGTLHGHRDAAAWLESLISGNAEEERTLSLQEKTDAVHMANLHKVKGLEAPVVILTAAGAKKRRNADARIEYRPDGADGYLFKLKKDSGFAAAELIGTTRFADQEEDEADALSAEKDREIYVAATRAKNVLILSECMVKRLGKSGGEAVNTRWQPLIEENTPYLPIRSDGELESVKQEAAVVRAADLYNAASQEDASAPGFDAAESFRLQTPSHLELISNLEEKETRTEDPKPDPYGLHHSLAAVLGTMTHRLMEMLVGSGFRLEPDMAVPEIVSEYGTDLSKEQKDALESALKEAGRTMLSGGYPQENGSAQDLFAELKEAEEICCELPFTYWDDAETPSVLWDGVMDLVYKKAGKWFIVDYKTNADGHGLDTHYRGQLEAYKKAFLVLTGKTAETRVYHVGV